MARTTYQDLLDAGVHFGHLTRKWDPKMSQYIFMERNGIHIIDLNKTLTKVEEAAAAIKQIVKSGRKVLFVATKKQAKDIVAEYAKNVNMPFITERYVNQLCNRAQVDQKDVEHR
jgi:small subunit ribosomal protein S2